MPGYFCLRLPKLVWAYGPLWIAYGIFMPILFHVLFSTREDEIRECKHYVNGELDISGLDQLYLQELTKKCGEPIDCNESDE